MVRAPKLFLLASLSMMLSIILRSDDNPKVQIGPRAQIAPGSNSRLTIRPTMLADLFWLKLRSHGRNNPPNVIEPTGTTLDTNDLSDKDKILWLKVANLANICNENSDYVNPVLHASYAALESGFRVFKVENNSHLGSGTAGQFTITKFNGPNDFSEARIDLNFQTIKAISQTTAGNYDPSFQKYSGLLGGNGLVPRLAETFGHEANHAIFAQRHPAQGTAIQKLLDDRDAAIRALPLKGRYPLPPDVLQKVQAAEEALVPTERFAEAAERTINEELRASRVKSLSDRRWAAPLN
jgi:hypothetical protein